MSRPPPDPPSDQALLRSYRLERDMDSFQAILHRHQADLLRLATALLGDAEAAKDAVQECFLRLVRDADTLVKQSAQAESDGHASLGGWLCTVLRNHCLDQLRRRSVIRFTRLDHQPSANGQLSTHSQPAVDGAPAAEPPSEPPGAFVWTAVASLPHLERAAVVLRYRDGLSYQEIAERLGKSSTHVGVLLYQGLGRLRQSPALRAAAGGG